jgi:hypothetical protein
VRVSAIEPAPEKPVIIGGYSGPPEGREYVEDYAAHKMRMGWYNWMPSKDRMRELGARLLMFRGSPERRIRQAKELGLDYSDYAFAIKDEPSGKTEKKLKPFIDEAREIKAIDPEVRVCFNPGEAATLETFQILDPYCDLWMPYSNHRHYHPRTAPKKKPIFTVKPWLWYTTPCGFDAQPRMANHLYANIRSVPTQPGQCIGFSYFAFHYVFRHAWDTAHQYLGDASVVVLPSPHGPVPTMAWEATREAIEHADLARMVEERAGEEDEVARRLVGNGNIRKLIEWLEDH